MYERRSTSATNDRQLGSARDERNNKRTDVDVR